MRKQKERKYIFVVGGVMSGVGKGITSSSIARLLKSCDYTVTALKVDPYINVDAGTMNPTEHGEVFVLADGDETDQDMGNYERFLGVELSRLNYMTTGRVYQSVIERERSGGLRLASLLNRALTEIGHCSHCRTFTENDRCEICANPKREENGLLCVVESPADVAAIEQTGQFSGRYFVLMGHLSPLDGIGPEELGLEILERRLQEEQIKELILATNPTIEGDATAWYIADMARTAGVEVSRIAHGVPVGGELELVDGTTLSHSLMGRQRLS